MNGCCRESALRFSEPSPFRLNGNNDQTNVVGKSSSTAQPVERRANVVPFEIGRSQVLAKMRDSFLVVARRSKLSLLHVKTN